MLPPCVPHVRSGSSAEPLGCPHGSAPPANHTLRSLLLRRTHYLPRHLSCSQHFASDCLGRTPWTLILVLPASRTSFPHFSQSLRESQSLACIFFPLSLSAWFNLSSILAPSQTRFPTPCHRPRPKRGSPAFDPLLEKATWSHALSPRGAGPGRNGHLAVHALALGTPGAATSGSVLGASPRRSVRWRREDMTLVPPAGQGHSVNGGTNSYYY